MKTKLDEVCDAIADILINEGDAALLYDKMQRFQQDPKAARLFVRYPAFRKLWDALEEAAAVSSGADVKEDDKEYEFNQDRDLMGRMPRG